MNVVAKERVLVQGAGELLAKVRLALPGGQTLPDDVWQKRHHALFVLLCLHALAMPTFGVLEGYGALHALGHGGALAALTALAYAARHRRRLSAVAVSLGLITSSALVVHVSGGVIEAHFHFFVMIVVLSLYEDWLPFLVAAAYVVVHHGLTGALDPYAVYNHPDAVAHPWKWALIHAAFVTAAGIASVVAWRLNEAVRAETREAYTRARESEQALGARERETRTILESAHEAFISIDARGLIVDWNQQAVDTFGWPREAALGRELAETIIPERHREAHRRGVERFLASGEGPMLGKRLELTALERTGREFPVELTISPLETADGYGFYAFLHDITERKEASELLDRRRRQLAEAQAVASLGSWDWDVATDTIEWSDELCRIYGVDPASHPVRFEEFLERVHHEDRAAVETAIYAAYTSGDPFSFEHRIVRPDGTVRVTSARGEVIVGDARLPRRMFGTAQDVTERKEAEEAQRQLAAIVESCEEAIIGEALDGTILSWNSGAQRMYGYTAREALGQPVTMLVPADRREEVSDMLARIGRGDRVERLESVRVRKDGREIDVALTVSPIRDGAGALGGASVIARDISEQKLRERYLRVQHDATCVLAETPTTAEDVLPALLKVIGEGMDWPVGAAWMPSREDGSELRCKAFWHSPEHAPEVFEAATRRIRLAPGSGLPGSVWKRPEARWVPDVTVDPEWRRVEAAAADGLHACILLPVVAGTEVLAVIEFLSYEVRSRDAALLELLDTLSAPIGQFLERKRADEQLAHQACHDPLTGLANRRKLVEDLERAVSDATDEQPQVLLILDLDGFKAYNDSFGHAAGDALLARLGGRLAKVMHGLGTSYRMGGDEFCVIASASAGRQTLVDRARRALDERGEAFVITASCGSALLPVEADTPSDALGLADRRMYAQKGTGDRASAARQSTDVLVRVLGERSPELGSHLDEVTGLCEAVARALALPEDDIANLARAASLHDVGKVAIPGTILNKTGPLDDNEWAYIRRHTLIGERILVGAPALVPAARLVRSSHERLDGRGYPDGLAGDEIPLGARIIAACDAFDAMTAERPYSTAISTECALSELRSCAGTQFDPAVVDALIAVVVDRRYAPRESSLAAQTSPTPRSAPSTTAS